MMRLREMNLADIDAVMRIEQGMHAHPWTRGNFTDALKSDSVCKVYEDGEEMLGYVVLMPAVDEMQLLNISIAAEQQRKGLGRKLMGEIMEIARGMNMRRMLLEVRPSNVAALGLYRDAGFREIGLRRGYYPAAPARGTPNVGNPLGDKSPVELSARQPTPVKGTPPDTRPMGGLGVGCHPSADNGREDAIVMECRL
jgi:[ribosomal protein S18]-alanine N-acetyltransferase